MEKTANLIPCEQAESIVLQYLKKQPASVKELTKLLQESGTPFSQRRAKGIAWKLAEEGVAQFNDQWKLKLISQPTKNPMKTLHIPPRKDDRFLAIALRHTVLADAIEYARGLNFEVELAELVRHKTTGIETEYVINLKLDGITPDDLDRRIELLAAHIHQSDLLHIRSTPTGMCDWVQAWDKLQQTMDDRPSTDLHETPSREAITEYKSWFLLLDLRLRHALESLQKLKIEDSK